jgi:hypothetical protein
LFIVTYKSDPGNADEKQLHWEMRRSENRCEMETSRVRETQRKMFRRGPVGRKGSTDDEEHAPLRSAFG